MNKILCVSIIPFFNLVFLYTFADPFGIGGESAKYRGLPGSGIVEDDSLKYLKGLGKTPIFNLFISLYALPMKRHRKDR